MDRWTSDAFPSADIGRQVKEDVLQNLEYTFHPLFDWRPLPNQKLTTVQINAHGLRSDNDPLRPAEIRCVVLGGSFAWGFGASSNAATPAALIAKNLSESPGRTVAAVNLADQAYCSIQEIKSFVFSVDELRPDLVVCITGVNDTGRGRVDAYKREPRYIASCEFINWGIRIGLLSQFHISESPSWKKAAKVLLRDRRCPPYPGEEFFSFAKPACDEIPHTLLRQKVDLLTGICANRGIKLVFVLQPMLHLKKQLSDYEASYVEFIRPFDGEAMDYYRRHIALMKDWFALRQADEDALFIDSTTFFDEHPETAFFDGMHVSDHGYSVWVDELCALLQPLF